MLQMRVSNERRDEGLVSENIPLSLSVLRCELPHIPEDQQTDDLQPPGHPRPRPQWHSREPRKVHSNWEHQTLLIEFAGTFYLLELVRSFYFSFCLLLKMWKLFSSKYFSVFYHHRYVSFLSLWNIHLYQNQFLWNRSLHVTVLTTRIFLLWSWTMSRLSRYGVKYCVYVSLGQGSFLNLNLKVQLQGRRRLTL